MENRRIGVGFGVMIRNEQRVLLGKRHSDPEKASSLLHGEGTWTFPGGKLHFGETFERAVCREVLEETGLVVAPDSLRLISVTNDIVPDAHFVTLGFMTTEYSGVPAVMEPDEIVQWEWFTTDRLPALIFPPTKKVLDNYRDGVIYRS